MTAAHIPVLLDDVMAALTPQPARPMSTAPSAPAAIPARCWRAARGSMPSTAIPQAIAARRCPGCR